MGEQVSASNNLALCALHCCDLTRAVRTLEGVVRADPGRNMHAVLVFNLCTLYDLACTAEGSKPQPGSTHRRLQRNA